MRVASVKDNGDFRLVQDGKIDIWHTETLVIWIENGGAISEGNTMMISVKIK
jgi:hypothetical protein